MSNKRHGRVFSVIVTIALGLMATVGSAANAQWLENGSAIATNKQVEGLAHSGAITLDVPSKNLQVQCFNAVSNAVSLIAGSLTQVTASVRLLLCEAYSNGVKQPNCFIGAIELAGKGKLIVHGFRTYVLFEPNEAGGNFGTALFEGELCALPPKNNIKGTLVAECITTSTLTEVDCLTSEVTHGLREALNAATLFFSDGLRYGAGEVPANILGVATAKLASWNTWTGHL